MKGSKRHNRHNRYRTQKVNKKGLDYELLAKNVFLLKKISTLFSHMRI